MVTPHIRHSLYVFNPSRTRRNQFHAAEVLVCATGSEAAAVKVTLP